MGPAGRALVVGTTAFVAMVVISAVAYITTERGARAGRLAGPMTVYFIVCIVLAGVVAAVSESVRD